MLRFLPVLGLLSVLASCGPNFVHESALEIPETGWTYQDSLTAQFEIEDSLTIYNLHLLLEHDERFPFQNFYVQVHTKFPDGQRLSELVSLELANKVGRWLGECSSTTCQLDIPIQEGAYFNQIGEYQITIEQYSRRNPLPGVLEIGFAVEETKERRG
ncbi:MAG: gliding motility lipoprotein GldH [Bacteroidota bacterium]